ncbi:MAG: hypothetical protein ACE5GM_01240 [bacterium]
MQRKISFLVLLAALLWFSGCASSIPNKMSRVKVNMSKEEVAEIIGDTGELKSSKIDPDGKVREIWNYSYYNDLMREQPRSFELYFLDDRLVKVERR